MNLVLCICLFSFAVGISAEEQNLKQLFHDGDNKLTAKMFYEVAKSNPDKSIVLSAFSVMTPLAQLALASLGESHDELLDSIGMPNDNITKASFALVNAQLTAAKGVTVKTASKIYVAEKFELNNEFADITRDTFRSEVEKINFIKNEDAAKEINAWVENQTDKRIKDLVDPKELDKDSTAILVNAIYFKGTWWDYFDRDRTTNKKFYASKNKEIEVPMMSRTGFYNYNEQKQLNAQILQIPYRGNEASFIIVLPKDVDGIKDVEEKLRNPSVLDEAMQNLKSNEVDVTIPKFKIETTIDLKDILQKININKMFDAKTARLNNLIKGTADLYIDTAVQKTFIEVNEEGTEAAAANEFEIAVGSSFNPEPPISFVADHPFVFFLIQGNNILFNGIYNG